MDLQLAGVWCGDGGKRGRVGDRCNTRTAGWSCCPVTPRNVTPQWLADCFLYTYSRSYIEQNGHARLGWC